MIKKEPEAGKGRAARPSPRQRTTPTSVADLPGWLDQQIDRLLVMARELLDDPASTGKAALRVIEAAEVLALTRQQGRRVYEAAIEQLRDVTLAIEELKESESAGDASLLARATQVEDGYRDLILRLNPRAVIGDLL
jgi:hypothetical protein